MTTKEAARYLRVSHRTMEDWRLRGWGPCFSQAGKRVLYRKSDLDGFLAARTFKNTGQARVALRQVQRQAQHPPPEEFSDEIPF
jgi:excisionase family DNA binding protein